MSISSLATRATPISTDAPWSWLAAGWRDMMRAPLLSLGYGAAVVGGGVLFVLALWATGNTPYIPVAFGMFAIVGPLLAVGLYEMSRRIEAGEAPRIYPIRFAGPRSPLQIAFIGFFLMFAALVWVRVAMLIYALFTLGAYGPVTDFMDFALTTVPGISMLIVGTIAGGFIAFGIYLLTVISIPMLMNERTDAFTAIAAGVDAFQRCPAAMLLWAWLIAIITAAGVATFFVGLVVAFPLLGHASWHAYRAILPESPQG